MRLAKSLAGHDGNQYFAVIREDEEHVYLANGSTRTLEHPKKKKRKHIQIIKELPAEVSGQLEHSGELENEAVAAAIKMYGDYLKSKND